MIRNSVDLSKYCNAAGPAYIQEYLPIDRDIRAVVIGGQVVHAYWRVASEGEFRTNLAAGGRIDLSNVPDAALTLAREAARRCAWDDVGIDICIHQDEYYILEANMKYGREGFRKAGLDYLEIMVDLINTGVI